MNSDIEAVVEKSKIFERMLRTHFKAKGAGLGKLLDSLSDDDIPRSLRYLLRRFSYIRNSVVHGDSTIKNREDYNEICAAAMFDLEKINSRVIKDEKTIVKPLPRPQSPTPAVVPIPYISASPSATQERKTDPYVVDIHAIGRFGSDVYENQKRAQSDPRDRLI